MINRMGFRHNTRSGQALVEIATFGAVFIFLIGMIIRSHISTSFSQNYKVRALKMALKQSFEGFQGSSPNTSRNSASVLFVEDRIAPDLNKYNTLDRSPFIANASATMSNLLEYPVDAFEFTQNIPMQDVYINGQHFEFTSAGFVFRTLYDSPSDCNASYVRNDPAEHDRCVRQTRSEELSGGLHKFFIMAVNGTEDFDSGGGSFDYLRGGLHPTDKTTDTTDVPPSSIRDYMSWQWTSTDGRGNNSKIDFGSEDSPSYPSMDVSGSLREQTLYYISPNSMKKSQGSGCLINSNPHLVNIVICSDMAGNLDPRQDGHEFSAPIKSVAVLDTQLGDIDGTFDPLNTPGPQPGFTREMALYTNIDKDRNSYLEIREGKLVDPISGKAVRSINKKDKADLVSRVFQLSNDTGRMCRNGKPVKKYEDGEENPVKACGDCVTTNFSVTCFDPDSRKLYIRANLLDYNKRNWFTNITKGL